MKELIGHRALLPAFDLVRVLPITLAGAAAQLFELTRRL